MTDLLTQSTARLLRDAAKNKLRLEAVYGIEDGDEAALLDGAVLEAAFELAVKRTFSPADEIRRINDLVQAARDQFPARSDLLPVRESQALVRAYLGEPQLVSHVPEQIRGQIEYMLFVKMVSDLNLQPTEIDTLISDAVDLAKARRDAYT